MPRRYIFGLIILNLAAALVIAGSLYDLLVPAIPQNHLRYITGLDSTGSSRFAGLDLAMLRSIGGCLLAIGVASLLLINGPVRQGNRVAQIAVAVLIGLCAFPGAFLAKVVVERLPVHVHTAILDAVVVFGGVMMIVEAFR